MKTSNYILSPSDFLSREERSRILRISRERSALDLLHGRQIWVSRYMLLDLALFSGLRVGEMASLKIRDLSLKGKDPYIIVRNGKGNRRRTVYIDQKLSDHLREYILYKEKSLNESIDPDSPLFSGREGNHPPTITLMKSFKKACEVAGLRPEISIHKCRHTYATYLLHATGNLRYVQRQLGHSSIAMTSLYADILPEENGRLANQIEREE